MKKIILIFPILFFLTMLLPAQNSAVRDSLSARFFTMNNPVRAVAPGLLGTDTVFTYRNLTFYNYSYPKGFVILRDLGGNYDVVGYSYDQPFSFDVDTTGFLINLANSLADPAGSPGYAPSVIHSSLKSGRYAIEPLIRTSWNQGWPYDILCPADPTVNAEDNRTLVGCVAVAMGQIIRYYDKWNNFEIYYSYDHPVFGTLTCNSGHYNWAQMENACYTVNYDVARLLYDCGVLVNMNYDRSGSGANSGDAAKRLNQIYGNGYLNETLTNEEEFFTNISNYMPIYATYPGHAFVCDGYDGSGFYHFNLGWGGSSNGYYALSNVLSHNLTSAIFNIFPNLPVNPPRKMQKSAMAAGKLPVSWTGPDQDRTTLTGYRIYLDDKYLAETTDTVFIHDCVAGEHYLKVSARFTTGESRWIGPASYYYDGAAITIPDATLKRALNTAIGISSGQVNSHNPTEGELGRISRLSVSNTANLSGLEYCINLKQLYLYSALNTKTLDMEQIRQCSGLALLSIENYKVINALALGNLTKLTELHLIDNQLDNTDFLKSLTLITKLQISDNNLPDITFLNNMERVEWLMLKNCGITGFTGLNNTYGLRTVDISNNQLASLDWLNGCSSLQTLNASNNKLTGNIHLTGLAVLTTIDLSNNTLSAFNLSGSPLAATVNLSNNKISDIAQLITDNPELTTLTAPHNLITSIPDISSKLTKMELQDNKISELRKIGRHSYLTYLNLADNHIVDLLGITESNYHTRLTYLNLMNNPVSKESFLEIIPVIRESGIPANLPAAFFPGSPCYLVPGNDTSMMSRQVHLAWQGDYNNEGYRYRVLLSKDGGAVDTIANGLTSPALDYEMPGLGKYNWQVIAEKDGTPLLSRNVSFKVMKEFSIPFIEDFEIYNPIVPLCAQSPYWRIFGPVQDPAKDAAVNNSKAFEGTQSIKATGSCDIWFPASEYLTGSCSIDFMMMVDKSRKAFFQVSFNAGAVISFYYYSEGVIEVYNNAVKVKNMTFKPREWMKVSVSYTAPSDYKIYLDSQVASEGKTGAGTTPGLSGIRFGTVDGPGNYQTLPFVYYVDNFAVTSGTMLGIPEFPVTDVFPAIIISQGDNILLKELSPAIRNIRVIGTDGRLLYSHSFGINENTGSQISIPVKEQICIVLMTDTAGRMYYKKLLRQQ